MKDVEIVISLSILDESIRKNLELKSSTVAERLETLKILRENGIRTVVFVAPIIPEITDFKQIIETTKDYVDEYWFDKLNLRTSFKTNMFNFIEKNFPIYKTIYDDIYNKKNSQYFDEISAEIERYCNQNSIKYTVFYAGHKLLLDK